jgi:hypothetical protein
MLLGSRVMCLRLRKTLPLDLIQSQFNLHYIIINYLPKTLSVFPFQQIFSASVSAVSATLES